MRTILEAPEYAGILRALRPVATDIDDWNCPTEDGPGQEEIEDDIEGEQETLAFDNLPALVAPDVNDDNDDNDNEDDNEDAASATGDSDADVDSDLDGAMEDSDGDAKMSDLRAVIKEASKGVVEGTDAEYKRYD
jgi:hypothetical protein